MIHVTIRERDAAAKATEPITSGSVGLPVLFRFSEDWLELGKTAVFSGSGQTLDMAIPEDRCVVPHEVLRHSGGSLKIGVYGTGDGGKKVTPTVWANAGVILPGTEPTAVEESPATQTLVQQLLEEAQAAHTAAEAAKTLAKSVREDADAGSFDGAAGAKGDKGDKGDTGATGPQGPKGDPGECAGVVYYRANVDENGVLSMPSDMPTPNELKAAVAGSDALPMIRLTDRHWLNSEDKEIDRRLLIYELRYAQRHMISPSFAVFNTIVPLPATGELVYVEITGETANGTTTWAISKTPLATGGKGVFIAQYGTTSSAEVAAALGAGKLVYAEDNGALYRLAGEVGQGGVTTYQFVRGPVLMSMSFYCYQLTLAGDTWAGPTQLKIARTDSPAFTGTPEAPTAAAGTNTTQIATTAFVQDAIAENAAAVDDIKSAVFDSVSLDPSLWVRGYISTNGRLGTDAVSAAYTGFVPAKAGMTIKAAENGYAWNCAMYSGLSESSFISRSNTQYNRVPFTIAHDCYIRFSIWKSDDSAEDVDVLAGKMDMSGIRYTVTEMICKAYFSRFRKKNIAALHAPFEWYRGLQETSSEPVALDPSLWVRGYISTTGRHSTDAVSAAYTGFVPAKKGMTIKSKERGYAWNCAMYSEASESSFLSRSNTQYNDVPYAIPDDCYIRFSIWKSDDSAEAVDVLSGKMDVSGITETVDAYTFGNASTTSAEVFAKFDALVTKHSDVLTSHELGAASDGTQVKEYVFTPLRPTYANVNPLPKILLTCGIHGGEKSSIFGTYYLLKDMLESNSTPLEFLRTSVELHMIPVANPYGVDKSTRWNANHVDINRNFDVSQWSYNSDTSSAYYAGKTPADQPETQILQHFIETNADAVFFIDFHTHGGQIVAQWDFVNWHSYPWDSDSFFNSFYDVSAAHISRVTDHFTKDYSLTPASGSIFGYIDAEDALASIDKYSMLKNVAAMTFEGFNGFPSESAPYSEAEKKANSELIGNWLKEIVNAIEMAK